MQIELFQSFSFFLPQLWMGTFLGVVLSLFGTFLVLRKMAFLGITLSQIVTSSVALSLFLGWKNEWFAILLSTLIFLPLVYFHSKNGKHFDSFLGILFVFFASLSQLLLSLGGNVKNHLMAAFFGDILFTKTVHFQTQLPILIGCLIGYFLCFHKFLFLAWDRDEFIVRGNSYWFYEIGFFLLTIAVVGLGVHFLGLFYSTAHMLIPAYAALALSRSMVGLLVLAVSLSVSSTWLGFGFSLIGFSFQEEVVYFPTSSTIVVVLSLMAFFLRVGKKMGSK